MWIKKLRKRKLQSVFIIFIVMICAMLMVSSVVIMTSYKEPYKNLAAECNSPALRIYLYDSSKENALKIAEKFRKVEGVKGADIVQYHNMREKIACHGKELESFVDLVGHQEAVYAKIRLLKGTHTLKEDGCLVPAAMAYSNQMHLGDSISMGPDVSYFIQGIYTEPYNMSVSFDQEIIVKEIPKEFKPVYYVNAYADAGRSGNDLLDAYREANATILEGRGITLEQRIGNNQMTDQILGAILLAMSVVILLVSGFMIRYMIKNTLFSEKKTIAIYKTMGYSNRCIVGIYMKSYLCLVLGGSLLGVVFSKIISDSFTKITYRNLGVTRSGNQLLIGTLCVLLIGLYVIVQVYLELSKTRQIKPMEVFRGESVLTKKVSKGKRSGIGFSPLSMAFRMMQRDKKNTILIIITCIMTAYCVNFAATSLTLIKGMSAQNYYWIGFDKHDVSVESVDLERFGETVRELRQLPEVERVIPTTTDVTVSMDWQKGLGDTILSAMVYESYENIEMPVLEGRNPKYPNEIAIGISVAEKLHKQVGDYINVYFNGTQKKSLLICGTFQSFYDMGKSCRLLGSTLSEQQVDFSYSEASLYLKKGENPDAFVKAYNDRFKDSAKLMNREHKYENILNMMNGSQVMAIKPFMGFALLLGGFNITAIVYLKNKDDKKSHSIYKAIGYSAGDLLKANMWYIFLIALLSLSITVPVFMFFFPKSMVLSLSVLGFKKYRVTYDIMALLISNGGALLVYLISALFSSKSLYENPIEDLTCE